MNKTLITLAVAGLLTGTAATATQAAEAFSFSLGDILEISVVNTDLKDHHDRGPAWYNPPPAPEHRREFTPPPKPEERKHRHKPQPPPPPDRKGHDAAPGRPGGFQPASAPAAKPAPGPAAKPAPAPETAPKPRHH